MADAQIATNLKIDKRPNGEADDSRIKRQLKAMREQWGGEWVFTIHDATGETCFCQNVA